MKTAVCFEVSECHPVLPPTDEDFDDVTNVLLTANERHGLVRQLVFTDGSAPNARQRRAGSEASKKAKKSRVAIVSSNPLARGAVTALSWLGVDIAAFNPLSVRRAIEFLGYDEKALAHIMEGVRRAERTFGSALRSAKAL